jgi:hypothetical protein
VSLVVAQGLEFDSPGAPAAGVTHGLGDGLHLALSFLVDTGCALV